MQEIHNLMQQSSQYRQSISQNVQLLLFRNDAGYQDIAQELGHLSNQYDQGHRLVLQPIHSNREKTDSKLGLLDSHIATLPAALADLVQ